MNVSIKKRLGKKRTSLYLEISGKGLRKREAIKSLWLYNSPSTKEARTHNKDMLFKAEIFAAKKREELLNKSLGLPSPKLQLSLIEYVDKFIESEEEASGNTKSKPRSLLKYLKRFDKSYTLGDISEQLLENLKTYLKKRAFKKDGNLLGVNSASSYFDFFKRCVHQAHRDGFILRDPALNVKSIQTKTTKKEYLEINELQILINDTSWKSSLIKRAFIFSCYTGIRFVDVKSLGWDQIMKSHDDGYYIDFTHKKTDEFERLYIAQHVYDLINEMKSPGSKLVFEGMIAHHKDCISGWVRSLGIDKHITYHCSRHTNATLLLSNGADIYTVSKTLGHKDVRTTEIYANLLDKNLRKAASLIPNLLS
jgi:integrase